MTKAPQRQISLKEFDCHRTIGKPHRFCLQHKRILATTIHNIALTQYGPCPISHKDPMSKFGELRAKFGEQQVANGLANCAAKDQADAARDVVNGLPIPQCKKDEFLKAIDKWEQGHTKPCCADCQEGCDALYNQLMETAGQAPLDGATGGSAPASGGAAPASGGGSANGSSCPADDGGIGTATETNTDAAENEEDGKCENWLVALAKAMADIQNKFLDKAMKAKSTMEENMQAMDEAADAKSEGRGDFFKGSGRVPREYADV
jgi:hypothetical protein